jgi:hypothetical protein
MRRHRMTLRARPLDWATHSRPAHAGPAPRSVATPRRCLAPAIHEPRRRRFTVAYGTGPLHDAGQL